MRYCKLCGNEIPEDWFDDICEECSLNLAGSIIHTEGIYPDVEDF